MDCLSRRCVRSQSDFLHSCLLLQSYFCYYVQATSALDTVTENSVQEALNTLGQNRTVLIIAHRLSTIRHADQIVVLDAGTVVEKGTHDVLVNIEGGYYQRLWRMQIRQKDEEMLNSPTTSSNGGGLLLTNGGGSGDGDGVEEVKEEV